MLPGSRLPRIREPITKSQSPARIGCSNCPISPGTSLPSPSMKTRMSPCRSGGPGSARPAIAALRRRNHLGAGRQRLGSRRIGAAVVHHNALADQSATAFPGPLRRCSRLRSTRELQPKPLPNQRLQRKPQLEQAGGGCGLNSARRNSWYFSPFQISRMVCWVALPKVKLS